MQLLDAVIRVNERQPQQVIKLLGKHFSSIEGRRIAVLGLTFKPGTDDVRESPAIPVVRALQALKASIRAYDPMARHEAASLFGGNAILFCDSLAEAIEGVDAIVLLTRWEEFKRLPELLANLDPQPVVVDGRRMLDKRQIARYEGIGL